MTRQLSLCLILALLATSAYTQTQQQLLRGSTIDNASAVPVRFAQVNILRSDTAIYTLSDSTGHFELRVPVGRYDIQTTCPGYEPVISRGILVGAAKQTVLTILLTQQADTLREIIVRPAGLKTRPLNAMTTVSTRMFSMEEARRYAGGLDDPARLASAFAGVSGNTDNNGIVVRGNAPKFVQWRMESVEIPSPNHFADLKTFGGGTLTALSSQVLANADFLTGAFPGEYNNALSGIFDLSMRNGNNESREQTFQLGITGIDASAEGPFKKGAKTSYLFNYRYSTLALLAPLLPDNANTLRYQDLSFKLHFPDTRAGNFSIWGIGLTDGASARAKTDSLKWVYKNDRNEDAIQQRSGAAGISHVYFFNRHTFIKTTFALTFHNLHWETKRLDNQLALQPFSNIHNKNRNLVFASFVNKKFSAAHTNKTGIRITGLQYDLYLNNTINQGPPKELVNHTGHSTFVSAYSSSSVVIRHGTRLNLGLNAQYFALNKKYSIEPRVGIKQRLSARQSLGIAYGLHSRMEKLNFYFNHSIETGEKTVNRNLGFTKAHHVVVSYDYALNNRMQLLIEPYCQQLFNVPVIADSSFSLLNLQGDWFLGAPLQHTGKGVNYGIDLTLEKHFSRGYYYLFTASLFKARYKAGDHTWRNTRFNRGYVYNALAGKEWTTGRYKQNLISLNARMTLQGGNRYSPVNVHASQAAGDIVYDEQQAFSLQASPTFNLHFTGSYRINRKKKVHELAIKILNLTGAPDFYGYRYNAVTHSAEKDVATVIIPNLSYKLEF